MFSVTIIVGFFLGIRMSTARAFIRPVQDRSNLHIMLNTTVTKVLVHPKSKNAQGVEAVDAFGHTMKILAKKEVIVSGGAVNSPQILLLSGIGPKEDLTRVGIRPIVDLPGVGKNLHNHVAFFTNFFINDTDTSPLNWATAMEYLLFRDGLMSGTGISAVTGKISSKYAERPGVPDIQVCTHTNEFGLFIYLKHMFAYQRKLFSFQFYFAGFLASCAKTGQVGELLSNNSRSIQMFPAVLHPKSRGYITLHSNDPLAPPKIVANYLDEEHDLRVLIDGIKFAIKLSETDALKAYGMELDRTPIPGCEHIHFGTDKYWECAVRQNTGPENHQAGSCKMGPLRDPLAVVDHELRVHGVRNLRVVDASVMPKVTSGNIAKTTKNNNMIHTEFNLRLTHNHSFLRLQETPMHL